MSRQDILRCEHDLAEREFACADGFCPLCMSKIIERLERENEAIMQGQNDLRKHIVNMREILGAQKGEDTIDACRRVMSDLAKARGMFMNPPLSGMRKGYSLSASAPMLHLARRSNRER